MIYNVRVSARAREEKVIEGPDGSLRIYLRCPPIEGRANERLRSVVAERFGVSRSRVRIIKGLKSKDKVIELC